MVDTYAAAQIERDLGKSWEDYKKEGNGYRYFLQPLTKPCIWILPISKLKCAQGEIFIMFIS